MSAETLSHAEDAIAANRLFEAERMAGSLLDSARAADDFAAMIRAVDPLWEARRRRFQAALDTGKGDIN